MRVETYKKLERVFYEIAYFFIFTYSYILVNLCGEKCMNSMPLYSMIINSHKIKFNVYVLAPTFSKKK